MMGRSDAGQADPTAVDPTAVDPTAVDPTDGDRAAGDDGTVDHDAVLPTTTMWEVFGRRRINDSLEHVGQIHAADRETALVLARETHFRHEEGVAYAVVRSDHLHVIDDPSLLERRVDIDYRLQKGYSGFRDKREAAREAARSRGLDELQTRPAPGRDVASEAS